MPLRMMEMKRVIVVGAGIIGLVLARELARGGIPVTVYDSKAHVADKTAKASGIFSKEGLAKIAIKYDRAIVNELNGAVIFAGGESMRVGAKTTKAYVLDRGIFAECCADEARAAGTDIVMGRRLTRDDIVQLAKDNDNVVVGADGVVSTVASAIGFPPIKEYVLTYKAEYRDAAVPDLHKVGLFFSKKIARRFFGWTVPYSKSKLEVGIGISSLSRGNSSAAFNAFAKTPYMQEALGGASKVAGYASMIPLEWRRRTVMGNVLLVGDAAGQVKATTGGGVVFGASCARIAADAIVAAFRKGRPLAAYEKAWRREHELDLRLHRIAHSYYSMLGDRGFSAMIKLSKVMGIDSFLGTYGDMDRPTLIIRRFFLRGISE